MDNKNKYEKIPVGILGATGAVGQRFISLLADHPWFTITALASSERSSGKKYADACGWHLDTEMPDSIKDMNVEPLEPNLPAKIVFSALPTSVARDIEPKFAEAGYVVCSNASAYRQDPEVPLLIPELNSDHLVLLETQKQNRGWDGLIVTSPNCTTTGIVFPLKPLDVAFGLKRIFATTMQAISGAGYPGLSYLDIADNVIPLIKGEEEKVEKETRLLLGKMDGGQRVESQVVLSAQTNRVSVSDGHTACLSIEFEKKPSVEEAIQVLAEFQGPKKNRSLPSAPEYPIIVRTEQDRPQPRLDRDAENGMVVSVGRVRPCPIFDLRMVSVVHNTLRGAASGAILNAELLVSEGYVD